MDIFRLFLLGKSTPADSTQPLLTLLLDAPPAFDLAEALDHLQNLENEAAPVDGKLHSAPGRPLTAEFMWGDHKVEVAQVDQPMLIESLDRCVLASHWSEEEKRRMTGHHLQLLLYYNGTHPHPIERYLALYKVASIFQGPQLLGVANEPAWTAHPAGLLTRLTNPEMLNVCRHSPPLLFWTGFLSTSLEGDFWFFTRGFHLFGFPDLAIRHSEPEQAQEVQELFTEVFHYLYFEKPDVQVTDIIQIEDRYYELTQEKGFEDTVGAPFGFYVLVEHSAARAHELMAQSQTGFGANYPG